MTGKPGSPLHGVLVELIVDAASLDIVAAAADLLARDARFNLWVATDVKARAGDLILDLVDEYQDLVDECCEALPRLMAARDVQGCLAAVRAADAKLAQLQGRG